MAINQHAIDDFLSQTEKTQKDIIERIINEPGSDPEDRIMRRCIRDLQLISTKTIAEFAKLEGEEGIQKGIVWVAAAMLEGVAAITASIVDGDRGSAYHFLNQLEGEMLKAAKEWKKEKKRQ